jgi:hypothetical protein
VIEFFSNDRISKRARQEASALFYARTDNPRDDAAPSGRPITTRLITEEVHMLASSADRPVAWTLSVRGNRIDCVLHRTERGLQVLIHTNGQPLYLRTLDNLKDASAWVERERIAWASL